MKGWRGAFSGGIRRRLALSFSLLVAAIAAFIVVFFPNRLERQASRMQYARAESVREMVAYSVRAALVFGDTSGVLEVLEGGAHDPDVRFLEVRDVSGRVVARRMAPETMSLAIDGVLTSGVTPDGRTYVTTGPLVHAGARVGTLTVGVSLASVQADVARARRVGLLVGALILLLGLTVVIVVSTLVTRPLKRVVHTAQRITAGDLTLRAPPTSDSDGAHLVNAFNQMLEHLGSAQHALATLNTDLEERVRARTAELQSLIDLAPEAVIAVDLGWRVTRWNRAAERLFGWQASEVLGNPLPFVPPEDMDAFDAARLALRGGQSSYSREASRLRKDGSRVTVLVSAGPLFDASEQPTGYLAFLMDLSERKALEQQLQHSQRMEAIGRLAGGIAHDFNNILTIITASAGLMRNAGLTADQRADLEQITVAAERAASLVRQLLTFSRQHMVQLKRVELNEIIHGMSPMIRRLLRENIRVTTMLSLEGGVITADPRQVEQMLMNLVVNASDAMPSGGRLTIETQRVRLDEAFTQRHPDIRPGDYVLLAVRDTGVGISSEILPRIFDPFFTTKEVGQGTGLGLATVYAVVKQLEGCILVESAPGMGSAFLAYLPRASEAAHQIANVKPAAALPSGAGTLLLVEDEEDVRRTVRKALERMGYKVLEAGNGEDGLAVAAEFGDAIDLVVTDLMMPGMGGKDFADRLTQLRPHLRVVFMSGYTDEATRDRGLVDETHRFISKPFAISELGDMIRSLLNGSVSSRS